MKLKRLLVLALASFFLATPAPQAFLVQHIGFIKSAAVDPMLTGADGALHITNGNFFSLAAGSSKSYTSVTIDAGGKLSSDGPGWLKIGVVGNLVINGQINMQDDGNFYQSLEGFSGYSDTALDGTSLFYTFLNGQNGGKGADCNASGLEAAGGASNNGAGGGGAAAGSSGGDDFAGGGGYGVAATFGGGAGGANWGNDGQGGGGGSSGDDQFIEGGSGGGGGLGFCGSGIYLKVKGNTSGSGSIIVSGQNGGSGGAGGSVSNSWVSPDEPDIIGAVAVGGGGGGGGAGGNGGRLVLKRHGTFSGVTIVTAASSGGSGGAGGSADAGTVGNANGNNVDGSGGNSGSNGDAGSSSVSTF